MSTAHNTWLFFKASKHSRQSSYVDITFAQNSGICFDGYKFVLRSMNRFKEVTRHTMGTSHTTPMLVEDELFMEISVCNREENEKYFSSIFSFFWNNMIRKKRQRKTKLTLNFQAKKKQQKKTFAFSSLISPGHWMPYSHTNTHACYLPLPQSHLRPETMLTVR